MLVVLRPGAAFRVVLDAEGRQGAVAEAFDRAVVQVALRDEEVARWYGGRVHLELVVLAGDVHPAGFEVLDRVVGAVVAVRQPRGRGAGGATHDLVAEADAEQRNPPERVACQLDGPVEDGRVTRAV